MELDYRLLVGIDWATEAHQVCVLDRQGRLLEQRRVEHRAEAIGAMINWLIGLAGGDPSSIAVAIEVPRGAVVEALVERGLHVFAINPKQLDRFRDRHTVAPSVVEASKSISSRETTIPPIASAWPPRYLVALCTTMSAPCFNG